MECEEVLEHRAIAEEVAEPRATEPLPCCPALPATARWIRRSPCPRSRRAPRGAGPSAGSRSPRSSRACRPRRWRIRDDHDRPLRPRPGPGRKPCTADLHPQTAHEVDPVDPALEERTAARRAPSSRQSPVVCSLSALMVRIRGSPTLPPAITSRAPRSAACRSSSPRRTPNGHSPAARSTSVEIGRAEERRLLHDHVLAGGERRQRER
jgi:hypothetical protein